MNKKFVNETEIFKNLKVLIRLRDLKLQEKEFFENKKTEQLDNKQKRLKTEISKTDIKLQKIDSCFRRNDTLGIKNQIKAIEKDIQKLCKYLPSSQYILSIRGISKLSAAIFLSEIEDPMRFEDHKHLLSYLGFFVYQPNYMRLCPGQRIVKKQLYLMSEQVVRRNEYFRNYYHNKLRNINDVGRKTEKTEAMFMVSIKLVRVMFALMREKKEFVDEGTCDNRVSSKIVAYQSF